MSFSKENEIIELLNSSDNDFSLPHKSLCVNDPVSSASKSALNERHISSSSLSKVNKLMCQNKCNTCNYYSF